MALPVALAAALSGASVRRLYYWASPQGGQPPLLAPEYRTTRPLRWSYRDLIALRALTYLRVDERTPLQRIRAAVAGLRDRVDGHLAEQSLATAGGTLLWMPVDGEPMDPVTGQQSLRVLLDDVLGPFRNAQGAQVLPLPRPYPQVELDPTVLRGYPVVAGTRVPFHLAAGLVRDGVDPRDVRDYYPGVDAGGARDAARLAHHVAVAVGSAAAA